MSRNFVIDSRKYSISVKVLTGQGDGDLIYIDASGHIHHVGPNPAPLRNDRILAAVKQIRAFTVTNQFTRAW